MDLFWRFIFTYIAPLWLLTFLFIVALGLIAYRLGRRLHALESRYQGLMEGVEGGNLEQVLNQHLENVHQAVATSAEAQAMVNQLAVESRWHLQHCGVVRFNPFLNTGGDQSFCIALADDNGNGVVITSLHARDGTRVYAKPLTNWESPYPLTDEERAAIHQAVNRNELLELT